MPTPKPSLMATYNAENVCRCSKDGPNFIDLKSWFQSDSPFVSTSVYVFLNVYMFCSGVALSKGTKGCNMLGPGRRKQRMPWTQPSGPLKGPHRAWKTLGTSSNPSLAAHYSAAHREMQPQPSERQKVPEASLSSKQFGDTPAGCSENIKGSQYFKHCHVEITQRKHHKVAHLKPLQHQVQKKG